MYGYNFGMAGTMTPNGAYGNMAAQAPYRPAMPINLQGRVVASVDEVRASQVPLDGSVSYFPSPGEGKIYAKGIDMQGLPYIQVFAVQQAPVAASSGGEWQQGLENRVAAIEVKLKEMLNNGQSQPATVNTNAGM